MPKNKLEAPPQPLKALELLHKELDVNLEEQRILKKRIQEIDTFLKTLPSNDPEFPYFKDQKLMDQISLDELVQEEEALQEKIQEMSSIS